MVMEHTLAPALLRGRVKMLIIGCGGNGSAFFSNLIDLHHALVAWGHPGGLDVTVMDGDVVSETNCVRQRFSVSDVGQNKAQILVNRFNMFYNLGWTAEPSFFKDSYSVPTRRAVNEVDILVGCVDTRAARREIVAAVTDPISRVRYYLDLGNNSESGQFVLGQPLNSRNKRSADRLKIVSELYPEMLDEEEEELPSCSAAEALEKQAPFVNPALAIGSLSLLTRLFRYGKIAHQGGFWNAKHGSMVPLTIDPERRKKLNRAENRKKAA